MANITLPPLIDDLFKLLSSCEVEFRYQIVYQITKSL